MSIKGIAVLANKFKTKLNKNAADSALLKPQEGRVMSQELDDLIIAELKKEAPTVFSYVKVHHAAYYTKTKALTLVAEDITGKKDDQLKENVLETIRTTLKGKKVSGSFGTLDFSGNIQVASLNTKV